MCVTHIFEHPDYYKTFITAYEILTIYITHVYYLHSLGTYLNFVSA